MWSITTLPLAISGRLAALMRYAGIPSIYIMNLFDIFGSKFVNIISCGVSKFAI
jgi:hypothetical protein